MKYRLLLVLIILIDLETKVVSQNNLLQLYYESSNYLETPNYEQTINYCKVLDNYSSKVFYTTYGKSPQGRDLPLLIFDNDGLNSIAQVRKANKLIIMVQACIHAGEPDGKDAGLMLLRNIITEKQNLNSFTNITILFLPIVNVDGHERRGKYNRINQNGPLESGWRTTSQNYNLNRDFLKADAIETHYWLKLYHTWLPDFFIDIHVTDGADYQYPITYALEYKGDVPLELKEWMEYIYLKQIDSIMNKLRKPIFPYVEFRRWHDPRSGLISWVAPAMLSQGYVAANNRPGLLLETHMLKPYKERIDATYDFLLHTFILLNKDYKNLEAINHASDNMFENYNYDKCHLKLNYEPTADSVITDFLGYRYDTLKSELSGGLWFKYSKDSSTFKIPYFNNQKAEDSIQLPIAYVIPLEWVNIIEKMKLHNIEMFNISRSVNANVLVTRFKSVQFSERPNEGHQKITNFEKDERLEPVKFNIGDVVIRTNQRTAKLIAYALEPISYDSYFQWGFFNTVLQQKEYAESYVMEDLARKMLNEDKHLLKEYNLKMENDSLLMTNSYSVLNWFYKQTPYWDDSFNKYPIYKIYDSAVLKQLEIK